MAGVGSHGQLQGLGYHWELWATQSGGMSEHDALRVATALGAEAIGLDGDLGSIEPGKLADLVVLEANPLDDIRNTNRIRYVMKNGRLYDAGDAGRDVAARAPARQAGLAGGRAGRCRCGHSVAHGDAVVVLLGESGFVVTKRARDAAGT